MTDVRPVTVAIPTIGRLAQLRECLASVAACDPGPAEVLVVDQSGEQEVVELVESHGARYVYCAGRGRNLGVNMALREAKHDVVLFTDDDCTVDADWIGAAWERMSEDPEGIVTGRVLAVGDRGSVPSLIYDEEPRDYTGQTHVGAMYAGNMACNRVAVLGVGGFDPRMTNAGADNEFSYRWLRAGGRLRHDPKLVVWHHDWRTPQQMESLYVRYALGQGEFYAKFLRRGDLAILRFVLRDLYYGLRGGAAALVKGRDGRAGDWRLGILRGLPAGLASGWRKWGPDRTS